MSSISSENSNMLNNLRLEEQTDEERIKIMNDTKNSKFFIFNNYSR